MRKKNKMDPRRNRTKRDIKIVDLKGLTKSTLQNNNTLIIHIKNAYDEHFTSSKRDEIVETLK